MSKNISQAIKRIDDLIEGLLQVRKHALELPGALPVPAKTLRKRNTVKHANAITLAPSEVETVQESKPWVAVVRGKLVVVTFPGGRDGYLKHKQVLGTNLFGFSPVSKEWRASLAYLQSRSPETLKALGLAV